MDCASWSSPLEKIVWGCILGLLEPLYIGFVYMWYTSIILTQQQLQTLEWEEKRVTEPN